MLNIMTKRSTPFTQATDIDGDQVPIFVLSQPDTLSQLDLGVDVDPAQMM